MTDEEQLNAIERAVSRATIAIDRKITDLQDTYDRTRNAAKQDAERAASIALEDRLRLADAVKTGSERQATEVAEKVVKQMMVSLGLDPDKPGDFVRDMMFLRELRETFGSAKRHAILVLIGLLVMGMAAAVWSYIKTGAPK